MTDHVIHTICIAVLGLLGLQQVVSGWLLSGQMPGLCSMLFGLALLMGALYLYNKPFADK